MEYYSGSIDGAITSQQNKKILKYLNELNRDNKINIAIIGEDPDAIKGQKIVIEKIDRAIRVTGFIDYEKALGQHKHMSFDLVIVDEKVGRMKGIDIIQKFKDTYRQDILDTEFCINMPDKRRPKSYYEAQQKGVHYFIHAEMNSTDLTKKMLEIL